MILNQIELSEVIYYTFQHSQKFNLCWRSYKSSSENLCFVLVTTKWKRKLSRELSSSYCYWAKLHTYRLVERGIKQCSKKQCYRDMFYCVYFLQRQDKNWQVCTDKIKTDEFVGILRIFMCTFISHIFWNQAIFWKNMRKNTRSPTKNYPCSKAWHHSQ